MENLPFSYFDIAVVAVLLISGLLATVRGFVKELLHILGWIGAAVLAVKLFPYAQPYVAEYIAPELLANLATGAGIFLVSLVILSFVSSAIARRVRDSDIGPLDRTLGFLFGLVRGAVIVALAYLVLGQFLPPDDQPEWLTEAPSARYVAAGADLLKSIAPEVVKATLVTIEEASDGAQTAIEDGTVDRIVSGGKKTAADKAETGYKDGQRKDLDRLIENKQKQ